MERTLLRNARIVDGTGRPPFAGHVLVEGKRIAGVLHEGEAVPAAEREIDLRTLEAAAHRMTQASAARFGLRDRGRIADGQAADLVAFDPDIVGDTPPASGRPAGRPKGIAHVFVSGAHAVVDGAYQPEVRAGRVLTT